MGVCTPLSRFFLLSRFKSRTSCVEVMVFRWNRPKKHEPPNKVRDAILCHFYDMYRGPDGKMIEKHGGHEMVLEVLSTMKPPKVD